jgi:radical SAM enzyme (TIGR01210 family)
MNNVWELLFELNTRRQNYKKIGDPKKYISAWLEDDILPFKKVEGNGCRGDKGNQGEQSDQGGKGGQGGQGGQGDQGDQDQKRIKALVVILRTNGCSWSKSETKDSPTSNGNDNGNDNGNYNDNDNSIQTNSIGNCTMCGYNNDCLPKSQMIGAEDLVVQFKSAMDRFRDQPFDVVKIFTSGSFLDDFEVKSGSQMGILEILNENDVKSLIFETRPEFVNSKKLKTLKDNYNGEIQIAFGLESCNNNILKYSINKGFSFADYQKSAELVRKFDLSIKTYLLLKPPFLNENDAISDTLNSIDVLHQNRLTDCISINPVNVQKYTLVEYLYQRSDYRPPWLWSLVHVLEEGAKILKGSNIRLLSQPTAGGLSRGVHNCYKCDPMILNAINTFSIENDTKIFKDLKCECKYRWQDVLNLEVFARSDLF